MVKHKVKLTISIFIVILTAILNIVTGWILWYGVGYFLLLLLNNPNKRAPLVYGIMSLSIAILFGVLLIKASFWLADSSGTVFMEIILFIVFLIITTITIGKWKMKNDLW